MPSLYEVHLSANTKDRSATPIIVALLICYQGIFMMIKKTPFVRLFMASLALLFFGVVYDILTGFIALPATQLSPVLFTELIVQLVDREILGFSIYRIDKDKKMKLH